MGAAAALVVLLASAAWFLVRRSRQRQLLSSLRLSWGKPQPFRRRDADALGALRSESPCRLDDASAADLDLAAVFAACDRTLTEPGQQALYEMLRTPLMDLSALNRRSLAIHALERDERLRQDVQVRLAPLGSARSSALVAALRAGAWPLSPIPAWVVRTLTLLAGIAPLAAARSFDTAFAFAGVMFAVNFAVHFGVQRRVAATTSAVESAQALFAAAQRLIVRPLPGLEPEQGALRRQLDALAPLAAALAGVVPPLGDDSLGQYAEIYLLRAERRFARAVPLLRERASDLLQLTLSVGEFDALQSLASWRHGLDGWCAPDLRVDATSIQAEAVRHPLVAACVPNDVDLGKPVLVTGSNMSGKSTYLRAVALNALLAQVACTCLARSWRGPPVRLRTCLRRGDDVLLGQSSYFAEARGILEVIHAAGGEPRLLAILDEMYRGTSSVDRVAASAEVLLQVDRRGALVLAATHDHPLTTLIAPPYRNVHFEEHIEATGVRFDFRLREGPAATTRAIELLTYLGYPEEIVRGAAARLRLRSS